jgi:alpha-beta hydrolase superfamily lysophospholipase
MAVFNPGFSARPSIRLLILCAAVLLSLQGCGGMPLQPWHTERLDEEFTRNDADQVQGFDDYLQLEDRLFDQLDEKVYSQTETGPEFQIDRYSAGSAADPRQQSPDWNRSFELPAQPARGAVLLLHGMSDSPYSLRALGQAFNERGYHVLGLRLPGHGTAPSGLRFIKRYDMAAAVRLAMQHLDQQVEGKPVHIVGYSNGAALAVEFALDALEAKTQPVPASLNLISPAVGVHPAGALAGTKNTVSNLPGLSGLAFLSVQQEFDPYKYNSFATNAGAVVHDLTQSVARRIADRASSDTETVLPPVLVFKSTVDATVSTDAVIDRLLKHLRPGRHELVLFDVNRLEDPAPLTDRVMNDATLPIKVTLVTNENANTREVASKHKNPFSADVSETQRLGLSWPPGVVSLSHVALPFPPGDPLYGQYPPESDDVLFLGRVSLHGERGLMQIPADWFFRLRYNPFFDYLEDRALEWVDVHGSRM